MNRRYQSELALYMNARMSTAITKYPSGRYGIVGSVPVSLCTQATNAIGQTYYKPKVWDSEQEVKAALIAEGVPFFQLNDCTWYPHEPTAQDQDALNAYYTRRS